MRTYQMYHWQANNSLKSDTVSGLWPATAPLSSDVRGQQMSDRPSVWLDNARNAVKSEEYAIALEKYEYFFDHALEEDRSFYGVRLSYCLDEWARLGKKYPLAQEKLIEKKETTRKLLLESGEPERFHEFEALCRYLGQKEESMKLFLHLHESRKELAEEVVRYIWDRLVSSGNWEICAAYLGDPESRYQNLLFLYDSTMEIHNSDPNMDLENYSETRFVKDASNLLKVLTNTNHSEMVEKIIMRITNDTMERGREHLKSKVLEQVAL